MHAYRMGLPNLIDVFMQAERERVIGTSEQAAALDMLLSEKLDMLEKLPEAVRLLRTM